MSILDILAAILLRLAVSLPTLDPVASSVVAPLLAGLGRYAPEVTAICRVESRCRPVGLHTGHVNRRGGEVFYRRALARGIIDPDACDAHRPVIAADPAHALDRWGIRGSHGHAAAYAVRHLGPCVSPDALDIPMVSALATARRLRDLEATYRLTTASARAHAWRHGVGCRCEER